MLKRLCEIAVCGVLLCVIALPASGSESASVVPQRVVSLNLCTDELLLLLADPEQIHSMTWLVKDPMLSWFAAEAKAYPANRGLAEEILLAEPDLVLTGMFTAPATVALLKQFGVPLLQLPMATNYATIVEQIRTVARALGQRERGEQVITQMRARLAQLPPVPRLPNDAAPLTAALFQPNGLTATADTLVHAALEQAGLRNLAEIRQLPNFARLPLETLLYDQPDLLVLNDYLEKKPSLAQQVMRHPALQRSFVAARKVVVPAQAWSCGTPNYVRAVEILRHAAIALISRYEQAG